MQRGRKPKPSWMKIVAGNPGRRPLNFDEPIPVGDLTEPPEWMNAEQRKSWGQAIASAPEGLLKQLDTSILVVWVCADAVHRIAAREVGRLGSIIKGPGGVPMQNPYMAIQNKQAVIMMRAASEMGFTPSARSRVKVEKSKGANQNPFAGLNALDD